MSAEDQSAQCSLGGHVHAQVVCALCPTFSCEFTPWYSTQQTSAPPSQKPSTCQPPQASASGCAHHAASSFPQRAAYPTPPSPPTLSPAT